MSKKRNHMQKHTDIHRDWASKHFKKPPICISEEEREFSKTINFCLIYGMGPARLQKNTDNCQED